MSMQAQFAQQLAFVAAQRQADEGDILAQALREGVQALYREALLEAYLLKRIPREQILQELGPEQLEELEYQRDALARDVAWGRHNA
jgi:hypothetical protein